MPQAETTWTIYYTWNAIHNATNKNVNRVRETIIKVLYSKRQICKVGSSEAKFHFI